MNMIDAVPYRRLKASGLEHRDICILIGDIVRAGGIDACRDAKGILRRGAMALLEVEERIDGELIEDRGKNAMRIDTDKVVLEPSDASPVSASPGTRYKDGSLFQSRIVLTEGVLLQGDSLILYGEHSATVPESVLVAAAGRPLTRLVDHSSLSDLIVKARYQSLPGKTIIEVRHPVIELAGIGLIERIRSMPRIMARQRHLLGKIRHGWLAMRLYMILTVNAALIIFLLLLTPGLIVPTLVALTVLAMLYDAWLPTSGDMKAHIRMVRERFPRT